MESDPERLLCLHPPRSRRETRSARRVLFVRLPPLTVFARRGRFVDINIIFNACVGVFHVLIFDGQMQSFAPIALNKHLSSPIRVLLVWLPPECSDRQGTCHQRVHLILTLKVPITVIGGKFIWFTSSRQIAHASNPLSYVNLYAAIVQRHRNN